MVHQKLCFFFPLLTNLTMPIVFNSSGGGRQNYRHQFWRPPPVGRQKQLEVEAINSAGKKIFWKRPPMAAEEKWRREDFPRLSTLVITKENQKFLM